MTPKLYNRLSEVQQLGPDYQRAIRDQKPEIGWQGDPDLTLAYHELTGWEVLREEAFPDGAGGWAVRHVVIARQAAGSGTRFDINALLRGLVDRDTRVAGHSHKKASDRLIDEIARSEVERERKMFEAMAPVHEELAWTVAKETGSLSPIIGQAGLDLPGRDAVDS